jgi:hypothetical protein
MLTCTAYATGMCHTDEGQQLGLTCPAGLAPLQTPSTVLGSA